MVCVKRAKNEERAPAKGEMEGKKGRKAGKMAGKGKRQPKDGDEEEKGGKAGKMEGKGGRRGPKGEDDEELEEGEKGRKRKGKGGKRAGKGEEVPWAGKGKRVKEEEREEDMEEYNEYEGGYFDESDYLIEERLGKKQKKPVLEVASMEGAVGVIFNRTCQDGEAASITCVPEE